MSGHELKIIQFVKGLDIGGLHGGADLYGLNLACALRDQGAGAQLCVFYQMHTAAEEQYLTRLAQCEVEVIFLCSWPGRSTFRAYFAGMVRLAKILRRQKTQVLHSHFHVGTLMAVLLKLLGMVRRVARTAHVDREWLRGWQGLAQGALIRVFIFVLFPIFVDIEGGVSQTAVDVLDRRWLARWLGKRSAVTYNAIPPREEIDRRYVDRVAREPKIPGKFTIGSVGRLTEQKGYEYLVEAAARVLQMLPEARFWVAGAGPLHADLIAQAHKLGVDRAVQFLGKRDDIPALLDQADLFVLPSLYEGLPTVVLESMARGVPVIATDIAGTREIVSNGSNGWLVPVRDAGTLADCILSAFQNPAERARVAVAALDTLQEFSIDAVAKKYISLYQDAL